MHAGFSWYGNIYQRLCSRLYNGIMALYKFRIIIIIIIRSAVLYLSMTVESL